MILVRFRFGLGQLGRSPNTLSYPDLIYLCKVPRSVRNPVSILLGVYHPHPFFHSMAMRSLALMVMRSLALMAMHVRLQMGWSFAEIHSRS